MAPANLQPNIANLKEQGMTANLQKGVTVAEAAKLMNVSYMARKVMRVCPHLEPLIMAGKMSLNEAYRLATNKGKPTSWDRLWSAWRNATEDDQARLAYMILEAADKADD